MAIPSLQKGRMSLTFAEQFILNFMTKNRYMLIMNGLSMTLRLTLFSALLGVVLGAALALMRLSSNRILRGISGVYIDIIRGTPSVVQILIWYYVIFGSVDISKMLVGVIAFGVNSGGYTAEIVRAGILSVDQGQTEAGRSLGLSGVQTMIFVVLPQAIKNALPPLANEFIVLMKETAIVGYIALQDLTKAGEIIRSQTYDAFMPLIFVALIYYIIIKVLSMIFDRMERRLRVSDHR